MYCITVVSALFAAIPYSTLSTLLPIHLSQVNSDITHSKNIARPASCLFVLLSGLSLVYQQLPMPSLLWHLSHWIEIIFV